MTNMIDICKFNLKNTVLTNSRNVSILLDRHWSSAVSYLIFCNIKIRMMLEKRLICKEIVQRESRII